MPAISFSDVNSVLPYLLTYDGGDWTIFVFICMWRFTGRMLVERVNSAVKMLYVIFGKILWVNMTAMYSKMFTCAMRRFLVTPRSCTWC